MTELEKLKKQNADLIEAALRCWHHEAACGVEPWDLVRNFEEWVRFPDYESGGEDGDWGEAK